MKQTLYAIFLIIFTLSLSAALIDILSTKVVSSQPQIDNSLVKSITLPQLTNAHNNSTFTISKIKVSQGFVNKKNNKSPINSDTIAINNNGYTLIKNMNQDAVYYINYGAGINSKANSVLN